MIRKFFTWASPSLLVTLSVGALDRAIERRHAKRTNAPLPGGSKVRLADSSTRVVVEKRL